MYDGLKERATRVHALLREPSSGFVLVTAPSPPAMEEALYFHRRLTEKEMPFVAFIVNRVGDAGLSIAIMLMFLVLFRSMKMAVIAIIPNLVASLQVLGLMGWLNIPLDIMTITIAAISIGIGVDDTIHYIHRFNRRAEFPAYSIFANMVRNI